MIRQNGKYLLFVTGLVTCFFCFSFCNAQSPTIKTTVDKNEILIGEQIKLDIEADFPADVYNAHWLALPDSFQHFEVIKRDEIDSIYTDNKLTGLSQSFTITSFDSGKWNIPSLIVNLSPANGDSAVNLLTDSIPIIVAYSAPDSTNQLRDIKPIREVEVVNHLWYWIGGSILLLALILLSIWVYKKWKKKKPLLPVKSASSAYEEAMSELDKLKQYQLSNPEQLKYFHSKLADIFKQYLSYRQNKNYLNKTTDDVLLSLKEDNLNNEIVSNLAAALRCGDAVKFAKYLPSENVSRDCLPPVQKTIELLNKQSAF
jgi:hypothetical protein